MENSTIKGKYVAVWQKYVPLIMEALEAGGYREIKVSRELFESVGKRKKQDMTSIWIMKTLLQDSTRII